MPRYLHAAEVSILLHIRDDDGTDGDEPAACEHVNLSAVFTDPESMYESMSGLLARMQDAMKVEEGNGNEG